MAFITNITDLKSFVLRQLGSEAHKVEISDLNWTDIYNVSLKYITEYFDNATNEKAILMDLNFVQDLTLNDNIISVKKMFTTQNDLGMYLAYPGISPILDFVMDGDRTAVSSYLATMNYIRQINETFQKIVHFTYNSETHRLLIGEPIRNCLIIIEELEPEISLYNSRYFQKVLEMNCWKMWATNAGGKYKGWTIGNGVEINKEYMLERYNDLKDEIEASIENDEYSFLGPVRLGSIN